MRTRFKDLKENFEIKCKLDFSMIQNNCLTPRMLWSSSGNLPDLLLILCHLCLAINGCVSLREHRAIRQIVFLTKFNISYNYVNHNDISIYSLAIIWMVHLHIFLNKNANTEGLMFWYMLHDMDDPWKYVKWMKPITRDHIHMISFIWWYPKKGNL